MSVPGGTQRIDEIKVGDNVFSFDDNGDIHTSKVLKVHEHKNEDVVRYKLWGGKFVDATPNHWVLNQFNAFVGIGTLGGDAFHRLGDGVDGRSQQPVVHEHACLAAARVAHAGPAPNTV